jgi:hypothetical protein
LRDLIRREQNQNVEIEVIRAALIKAEGRGLSARTPDEIKRAVQKKIVGYKLNQEAEEDLDHLYEHGILFFGLGQADRYYDGLIKRFPK